MLSVDGMSEEEVAELVEKLIYGGEADVRTSDGQTMHISVDKIDPRTLQPWDGDWSW